jgi:hypothetical protein
MVLLVLCGVAQGLRIDSLGWYHGETGSNSITGNATDILIFTYYLCAPQYASRHSHHTQKKPK